MAEAYRRVLDPTLADVARRIVELARVDAGTRVLDLACGTGGVARAAHAHGAHVFGIDVAEGMVEVARATSPSEIRFEVGDAARIPAADGSCDVVTCGFGLSHMPDVPLVLDEVRRVLTTGGRFVASAWGSQGSNPAAAAIRAKLRSTSVGFLDEETWADPEGASRLLVAAGFHVEVASELLQGRFADAQAAVEWTLAWPAAGEDPLEQREELVLAAAQADLGWRYTVNYFVAV